jgi:clan AA aspartic protease (TIGR02281 family)
VKQPVTYLIALFLGLFVGWLGQQFWLGSFATEPSTSHSLARQYQRLNTLKEQSTSPVQETEQFDVVALSSSKFQHALDQKNIDQALDQFTYLDGERLDEALLLAELMFEQERYELLFSFLYDKRYGLDTQAERRLLNAIYQLVERVDIKLGEAADYDRLVSLYRQLSSFEGEHTFYYLRLSYWLLQSGNTQEASQSLLGVVNDIELEGQLHELQAAIELYDQIGPQTEVPLKMVGEHYLVSVDIAGAGSVELMLDTGASKTVIKRALLEDKMSGLLENAQSIQMNTANGNTKGLVVTLKNVGMSGVDLDQLEVVLMDLPNFKYDGLLGMNFLGQFDFKIDQEGLVLVLVTKKPKLTTIL